MSRGLRIRAGRARDLYRRAIAVVVSSAAGAVSALLRMARLPGLAAGAALRGAAGFAAEVADSGRRSLERLVRAARSRVAVASSALARRRAAAKSAGIAVARAQGIAAAALLRMAGAAAKGAGNVATSAAALPRPASRMLRKSADRCARSTARTIEVAVARGLGLVDAGRILLRRSRVAAAARARAVAAMRPAGARMIAPALVGVMAAVLVLVGRLGPAEHPGPPHPDTEGPTAREPLLVADADPAPRLVDDAKGSLSEDDMLSLVGEVTTDPREAATDLLLSGAESPSIVVSMASIRGLRGRPCARVARPLLQLLANRAWQRRAWAAKIVGENGCAAAAAALRGRLAHEHDVRVRRQIGTALVMLTQRPAG